MFQRIAGEKRTETVDSVAEDDGVKEKVRAYAVPLKRHLKRGYFGRCRGAEDDRIGGSQVPHLRGFQRI